MLLMYVFEKLAAVRTEPKHFHLMRAVVWSQFNKCSENL